MSWKWPGSGVLMKSKKKMSTVECFELVREYGGNKTISMLFAKFETAVDYAVEDLQYRYLECLATCGDDVLEAHYIDPKKMNSHLKTLRKYLTEGDGCCGIMSEYYEIHRREMIL